MQAVSKQLPECSGVHVCQSIIACALTARRIKRKRNLNHLHSRLTVKHCAHNLAFLLINAHSSTFEQQGCFPAKRVRLCDMRKSKGGSKHKWL
jgi:hypothetical protein